MTDRQMQSVDEEALDTVIETAIYGFDCDTGMTDDELDMVIDTILGQ